MYSSKAETFDHKFMVAKIMNSMVKELLDRAMDHDIAKLEDPELQLFDEYTPKLKGTTYGSDEYKQFLKELQPALDHHYARYRHHPEFGINNFLNQNEVWKDVYTFEGLYEISNYGRVKSLYTNSIIYPSLTPKGYYRIQLSNNGTKINKFIHSLVIESFGECKPQENYQVNHKNGIKIDNYIENLEWVSPSDNQLHSYKNDIRSCKYVIHCIELNLTTIGTGEMVRELKSLGYESIRDSGILACIYDDCKSHNGLHFIGYDIEHEYKERSMCSWMNILDIIEMLVDWKAATLRHNDGNILKSLEINRTRFGLDKVTLYDILMNSLNFLEDHNTK